MVIFNSIEDIQNIPKTVLTMGTFDGVHRGHKKIFEMVVDLAKKEKAKSLVITFDTNPYNQFNRNIGKEKFCISDLKTKINLISKCKIDYILVLPFNKSIAELSAISFLKKYIIKYFHPKSIVIGYDHHFGKDKAGDIEFLRKYSNQFNYSVYQVPVLENNELPISSSLIRSFISDGHIERAKDILGRKFNINGLIVHGSGRGKLIGLPTANIEPQNNSQLIPANGVYCVSVLIDNISYSGICNIGTRPTFDKELDSIIEVNIFKFNSNIYGKEVIIFFNKRIRTEKKFSNKEELLLQIEQDKKKCK
jgi:riboflavin kinase / FMN adenylyltransferase